MGYLVLQLYMKKKTDLVEYILVCILCFYKHNNPQQLENPKFIYLEDV